MKATSALKSLELICLGLVVMRRTRYENTIILHAITDQYVDGWNSLLHWRDRNVSLGYRRGDFCLFVAPMVHTSSSIFGKLPQQQHLKTCIETTLTRASLAVLRGTSASQTPQLRFSFDDVVAAFLEKFGGWHIYMIVMDDFRGGR